MNRKYHQKRSKKNLPEAPPPSSDTANEYMDILDIFHWGYTTKREVKSVETSVPFNFDYVLYDLSTKSKGAEEDIEFALNLKLRNNIRRGNTIIVLYKLAKGQAKDRLRSVNWDGQRYEIKELYWARRGMYKFFDMSFEFLNQADTKDLEIAGSFVGNFSLNYSKAEAHKEELRKVIFEGVEKAIRNGETVDVYKTVKANGENAQISYFQPLDSWIIASKNVSLIARNRKDLEKYSANRFNFAGLIANEWFNIIESMRPDVVNTFKQELSGHTIVGEYTGNQDYQHLIRYSKISLVFFALVDNNSVVTCKPPLKALQFFRKFNLEHVKMQKFGNLHSVLDLYEKLKGLFCEVSSETLEVGEEGAVLYFVKNKAQDNPILAVAENFLLKNTGNFPSEHEFNEALENQETLSLTKLKTLEYRIFRKIREKTKYIENNASDVYKKFVKEVNELAAGQSLPKPIEYYFEVARKAFEEIERNPNLYKNRGKYIDFLDKVLETVKLPGSYKRPNTNYKSVVLLTPPCYYSMTQIKDISNALGCSEIKYEYKAANPLEFPLYIFNNVPRNPKFSEHDLVIFAGYATSSIPETLNKLQEMKNSTEEIPLNAQSYIKNQNPEGAIKNLYNAIFDLRNFIKKFSHDFGLISYERLIEEALKLLFPPPKPKVFYPEGTYVIVPLGIPALGKTELVPVFQEIAERNGFMFVSISSDKIRGELYNKYIEENGKTDEQVLYDKTTKQTIKLFQDEIISALSQDSSRKIIYLDKNHPPNAIKGSFETIKKGDKNAKIIVMVPDCGKYYLGKNFFPMSLQVLLTCLLRIKNRDTHETLAGTLEKRVGVVMMMYMLYKNYLLDEGSSLLREVKFLKIPFVDEKIKVNENFENLMMYVLQNYTIGKTPSEEYIRSIIEEIEKNDVPLPHISLGDVLERGLENLIGQKLEEEQIKIAEESKDFQPSKIVQEEAKHPLKIHEGTKEIKPAQKLHEETKEIPQKIPEDVKIVEETKTEHEKIPVYLGLDLEEYFGTSLIPLITSALDAFASSFPEEQAIQSDLKELVTSGVRVYSPAGRVSDKWKFTNSLHLTSFFIGGNKEKLKSSFYREFRENAECVLRLTHIVYVPQRLICASAVSTDGYFRIENKMPHVTLLLGKWPAKLSNEVLMSANLQDNVSRSHGNLMKESVDIYALKLYPQWFLKGVTKKYHN
ncbi:unnamed protein product [Blepharisma stoltei]|uniref:Uncharacterized protein n=1 Tax=Blepharisma stoltei TaxID=1481888 RepID=A0AAU9IX51_9CILI|nr:unnamed protein product [Blepharisma stoltei]